MYNQQIDESIIIPNDFSDNNQIINRDNNKNINKVELKDNSKLLPGSLLVNWSLSTYNNTDKLALYQHDRLHDYNYIYYINLNNNNGYYTFKNLVDGFYDVRIINDKNIKYNNIKISVCCLGQEVLFEYELTNNENDDYPILKIKIPLIYIKNNNDCIAIFDANEHSNKIIKSYMYDYIYNGTDENEYKIISFNLKYISGSFVIKYFYYDSMSIINGNVYSGIQYINIPNYDNLKLEIDFTYDKIKIYWTLYSVDYNINQWIGIYENDNLIDYQYISKNKYLNNSKTKGVVIFNNKKLYEIFYKIYINNIYNKDKYYIIPSKQEEDLKTFQNNKFSTDYFENNKMLNLYTIKFINKNLLFGSNTIIIKSLKELLDKNVNNNIFY